MAWAILQDKYPTRLDVPHDEWDGLVKQIEEREKMKAEGQVRQRAWAACIALARNGTRPAASIFSFAGGAVGKETREQPFLSFARR